jgi:hypothetical protein
MMEKSWLPLEQFKGKAVLIVNEPGSSGSGGRLPAQWRKWRTPVKTMARPRRFAAAMTS